MEKVNITATPEETMQLGETFAAQLIAGDVVCLDGELGAGKTTFMQGLAKGLGIKRRILSPTFILARQYKTTHPTIHRLYHIDMYRVEKSGDTKSFGLDDMLHDATGVVAIEWAERLGDAIPKKRWDIFCRYIDDKQRSIEVKQQ